MISLLAFLIAARRMMPQAACMLVDSSADAATGELASRPNPGAQVSDAPTGLQYLDAHGDRSALLYVPTGYRAHRPAPLVVMLHGAGGAAARAVGEQ